MTNTRQIIKIKYRYATLDIVCDWIDGEGSINSYHSFEDRERAFYDSYDMKEFSNRQTFDKFVTKLQSRGL